MKKQLHLNQVIDSHLSKDVVTPVSINFEDVISYSKFAQDHNYIGKTIIHTSNVDRPFMVTEEYSQVRKMMEDLRVADDRQCYRIKLGYQVHYIPKDEVSYITIDEQNSKTTLVLKSGDKFSTGKTMVELRATSIEIPF